MALAIALLAYYLLTLGGHQYSSDGIIVFQSAKQLLFQHSLALDPPVHWDRDFRVSKYGIGMTLAYVPFLAVWWPLFDRVPSFKAVPYDPSLAHNPALYANLPYLLCSVLNPIVTAATACLVFRLGRRLGLGPRWSLAAAGIYGLASPAAVYARFDYAQPLAGLALTATLWALLKSRDAGPLLSLALSGTCLGYGVLTRPELLAFAPFVAAWAWWRERHREFRAVALRMAALLAPVAVAVIGYLWVSRLKFGVVGRVGYAPTTLFTASPSRILEGVGGLLLSPSAGLLVFFPLAALGVPGLVALKRGRPDAAWLFAGSIGVALALYGSYVVWWGGWCWGPRFLLPLLPILTLAATTWAARTDGAALRARRMSFVLLAVLCFAISLNGILFDFVLHRRWVEHTMTEGVAHRAFDVASSPLVTGWTNPPERSLDIFWLRLLDADQVRGYGHLLGAGDASSANRVRVYAAMAGALAVVSLLAVLIIAAHRLWKLLALGETPSRNGRRA